MCREWTARLVCCIEEIEVVVPLRIVGKRLVVMKWRDVDRRAGLPPADEASTDMFIIISMCANKNIRQTDIPEELAAFLVVKPWKVDRVVCKEFVELRHKLFQVAESEEGAILGPFWQNSGATFATK
jgi:hypothetical protein